jgi:L-lysine exporter family protein LysE/ArgO
MKTCFTIIKIFRWPSPARRSSVDVVTPEILAGFLTGLTLIIAIGAQNAFVLRQGLLRAHVGVVVAICAVSDLVLILAGITGIGTVVEQAPVAITVVRWLGVAFLSWYGVASLLRARRPGGLRAGGDGGGSRRTAVLTALALTWLNPHVYLDTVLLLGSVGSTHGADRWWFAGGATLGSILWFTSLGFGARLLAPLFAKPLAWRILDGLIAVVMIAIAVMLVLPH